MPHEDLIEAGKKTQFSSENQPQLKTQPWSIRNAVRRLGAGYSQNDEADWSDSMKSMAISLRGNVKRPLTHAERIAITRVLLAQQGDEKFSQHVTEDIDGKLSQNVKMEGGLMLGEMTEEELNARIAELIRKTATDGTA